MLEEDATNMDHDKRQQMKKDDIKSMDQQRGTTLQKRSAEDNSILEQCNIDKNQVNLRESTIELYFNKKMHWCCMLSLSGVPKRKFSPTVFLGCK